MDAMITGQGLKFQVKAKAEEIGIFIRVIEIISQYYSR